MKKYIILIFLGLIARDCAAQSKKDSLYVFVGERISVTPLLTKRMIDSIYKSSNKVIMDEGFKATYKVIQNVYNNCKHDTIEFITLSHFGKPGFSKYKYALIFVSEVNGQFHALRYQCVDVYPAKNEKWAYAGNPYALQDSVVNNIKPVPIAFKKPAVYNLKHATPEVVKDYFSFPYFKIKNNKATALMGVYVDDFFIIKKEEALKQVGTF